MAANELELISLLVVSATERRALAADPAAYLRSRGLSERRLSGLLEEIDVSKLETAARISARKRFARAKGRFPTLVRAVEKLSPAAHDRAVMEIPFGLADMTVFRRTVADAAPGLGDDCGHCLVECVRYDEERNLLVAMGVLQESAPELSGRPKTAETAASSERYRLSARAMLSSHRADIPKLLADQASADTPFQCRAGACRLILLRKNDSDVSAIRIGEDMFQIVQRLQHGESSHALTAEYGAKVSKAIVQLVTMGVLVAEDPA